LSTSTFDKEDTFTGNIVCGQWRHEIEPLHSVRWNSINNYAKDAEAVRKQYTEHSWLDGTIPGQWKATGIDPTGICGDIEDENEYDKILNTFEPADDKEPLEDNVSTDVDENVSSGAVTDSEDNNS